MRRDMYGAQSYRRDGTKFERGSFVPCGDADSARRKAEKLARQAGVSGAVAFLRRNYSSAFGDADDPITIAAFGDVPPEAQDMIPF